MAQFPEHEKGARSQDPKVVKLDKLGRILNIRFDIDGVPYGAGVAIEEIKIVDEAPVVPEAVEPSVAPVEEPAKIDPNPVVEEEELIAKIEDAPVVIEFEPEAKVVTEEPAEVEEVKEEPKPAAKVAPKKK